MAQNNVGSGRWPFVRVLCVFQSMKSHFARAEARRGPWRYAVQLRRRSISGDGAVRGPMRATQRRRPTAMSHGLRQRPRSRRNFSALGSPS